MKVLLSILATIFFINLYAQDTLYKRGADPFTARVLEVDDDYIIFARPNNGKLQKEKIKTTDLKLIRYKGGHVERYKADPKYTSFDKLILIDSRIIQGIVKEVGEDSVTIDTDSVDRFIAIPNDSIASVTYVSGFIQIYHEVVASPGDIAGADKSNLDQSVGTAVKSPDSAKTSKLYLKLIEYNDIQNELVDAKGNIENVKSLFDRVVNDEKYKGGNYDSLINEIIIEYCRLFDEDYFSGKKKDGMPDGTGVLYTRKGEIQSGEFVNGKLTGLGKVMRNSILEKQGQFSDGMLNGEGIINDAQGRVIKGMFIENQLSGQGQISFLNGAWEKGNYLKSRLNGEGERHLKDANYYKGSFKDGRYNGHGIYYWADTKMYYEGNFVNGKRDSEGELKLPDGTIISGKWKNDCPLEEVKIKQPSQNSGDFYTASWIIKDCNIESKKNINGQINIDESLVFLKMTGL